MCNKTALGLLFRNCSNKSIKCLSPNNSIDNNLVTSNLRNSQIFFNQINNFSSQSSSFTTRNFNNTNHKVLLKNISGCHIITNNYCTDNKQTLPRLMDFPQIIWPSFFKTVRNFILANFIISRYFDNEFNLDDFVIGSKQAVEVVSNLISQGELNSLNAFVSADAITQIKSRISDCSLKQRQDFALSAEDIYFCFPYEVGIMFPNEDKSDEENQARFVEITMCYHALQGLKELKAQGVKPPLNMGVLPEYRDKLYICNYRFIREFTKGVQDDWTINAVNHFKQEDS